ncbi:MAG: LD-carboxypeptidase, partial [Bryobacteraceae bacterium]
MIARRSFLTACGAGLTTLAARAAADEPTVRAAADEAPVRPAALRAGDTVGLITPGTYVSDPDRLALAVRTVEYFGLRPKMGRNVGKRIGYL